MSVINETLDNLKQTKKYTSKPLNPASSFYSEKVLKAEKSPGSKKSYIIPIGFAILVGVVFCFSQLFFLHSTHKQDNIEHQVNSGSWFKSNLQVGQQHQKRIDKLSVEKNHAAQMLYYDAMAALNEGRDSEALQGLKEILAQYPDFVPAQKAYSMLVSH